MERHSSVLHAGTRDPLFMEAPVPLILCGADRIPFLNSSAADLFAFGNGEGTAERLEALLAPILEKCSETNEDTVFLDLPEKNHVRVHWRKTSPFIDKERVDLIAFVDVSSVEPAGEMVEIDFHDVYKHAGIWTALIDATGKIIDANETVSTLLGYTRSELRMMTIDDISLPEDREVSRQLFGKLVSGMSGDYCIEKRYLTKHGDVITGDLRVTAVRDEAGRFKYAIGQAFDITERRRVELALKEAEQRFRAVFDSAAIGIVLSDTEGRITEANDAFLHMVGYSIVELRSMCFQEYTHPDDLALDLELLGQLFRGERSDYEMEKRFRHHDGGYRWVNIVITLVREVDGQPRYVIGLVTDIHTRKQTEEALRQSEERFRLLAENARDIVFRCRMYPERYFEYVSPSCTQITGYTPEEHYADPDIVLRMLHPDDRPLVENLPPEQLLHDELLQIRYIRRDGRMIWTEQRIVHHFDEEGHLVTIEGIVRDITERKQAEESLLRSNERYHTLTTLLKSYGYAYRVEKDGTRVMEWMTGAVEQIFGYTPREIEELELRTLIYPEDLEAYEKALEGLMDNKPSVIEYRSVTRSGTVRWVRVAAYPEWDERRKRVVRVYGTGQDITDRKNMEEALRQNESILRATIEALPDLMFRISRTGDYLDIHAPDSGLLAAPRERIIGHNLRDVLPPDIVEQLLQAIDRTLETGQVQSLEYSVTVVQGDVRDFEARLAVSSQNEVVLIVRDITGRKRYEAELIQARENAEQMGRLKDAFLANMSHEIRTPLTSILGFADLLESSATGETREFAELIRTSGRRLMDTLNSVLDLAQLRGGTLKMKIESVDLGGEIVRSLDLFRRRAEKKGLTLTLTGPDEPSVCVLADRGALMRILANLISNAIKFTETGSVTVHFGTEDGRAFVDVSDTGVGISEAFIPHLFDEFSQESIGHRRNYEGNGLGLAITHQLVELLNGEITVSSVKDRGTRFRVYLPPDRRDADGAATLRTVGFHVQRQELNDDLATAGIAKPVVLVVDDDPSILLLLRTLLRSRYRVLEASSGSVAFDLLKDHSVDVILLDIHLGQGENGVDLLRQLREYPSTAGVPVVSMTAYALPGDEERFMEAGFSAYLSKPFSRNALLRLLDSLVRAA